MPKRHSSRTGSESAQCSILKITSYTIYCFNNTELKIPFLSKRIFLKKKKRDRRCHWAGEQQTSGEIRVYVVDAVL
jgi:hypothetical protein